MCIYAVRAAARTANAETFVDSFSLVRRYIYTYMYVYLYIYIHIYIHMYVHIRRACGGANRERRDFCRLFFSGEEIYIHIYVCIFIHIYTLYTYICAYTPCMRRREL